MVQEKRQERYLSYRNENNNVVTFEGNEAMSGAKQNFVLGGLIVRLLETATHWHSHDISDRKILATDIEGVESVGAGGAVFEEVFLGFGELLA